MTADQRLGLKVFLVIGVWVWRVARSWMHVKPIIEQTLQRAIKSCDGTTVHGSNVFCEVPVRLTKGDSCGHLFFRHQMTIPEAFKIGREGHISFM